MVKPGILVVDDEKVIRQLFRRTLREDVYNVQTAENGEEALLKTKKNFFNLLILDLKMPGMNGVDVLKQIKKTNPYIEVIIITGYPTIDVAVESIKVGAFDFICKPFDIEKIQLTIEACLERQKFNISHVQLSELMTLFEVSRIITATTDLDTLLGRILEFALQITKAKRGSVLLLDKKTNKLTVKVARGLSKEIIRNIEIGLGESISGKVAEEGEAILVTDINHDSRFHRKNKPQYVTRSFMGIPLTSIPLRSKRNILGVINVCDKISKESFTEREKTLLSILAGQAAVATENAKLYSQLQTKITDLKKTIEQLSEAQNQLIQTEKMAALGTLSAGMVHEINNPLMGSALLIQSLMLEKAKGTPDHNVLSEIEVGLKRITNVTSRLLMFSRKEKLVLKKAKINDIVKQTLPLIVHEFELNSINLVRYYGKNLPSVKFSANAIQQVLVNVLLNAKDAVLDSKSKKITISTYLEDDKVKIKIKDKGYGIKKENLKKIFDPFFTTKPIGKNLGMGMSIVKTIMDQHRGKIDIYSEEGKNTEVVLSLPVEKIKA